MILLAGDIGGTKTILRLVKTQINPNSVYPEQFMLYEQTYRSQEFVDLVPMIKKFLATATETLGEIITIEKACFGIAGPVVNNSSNLTNLGWFLSGKSLEKALNIPQICLINDFAAIGYGVLNLPPEDLYLLQPGEPQKDKLIAIIGAGTGLGQGFLIPQGNFYQTYPSEGGHTDFAPRSELEFHLLRYIHNRYDLERVSVERIVSGMGIVGIYQFLREQEYAQESEKLAKIYQHWEQEQSQEGKHIDLAAEISQAAQNDQDYLCLKTMEIFMRAYGAEAGNLALKLLPYGGLYIAGGIAAKNLPLITDGNFLQAFLQKGRVSPLVAKIPVYIILNPRVGLIGAALFASQMSS